MARSLGEGDFPLIPLLQGVEPNSAEEMRRAARAVARHARSEGERAWLLEMLGLVADEDQRRETG